MQIYDNVLSLQVRIHCKRFFIWAYETDYPQELPHIPTQRLQYSDDKLQIRDVSVAQTWGPTVTQ